MRLQALTFIILVSVLMMESITSFQLRAFRCLHERRSRIMYSVRLIDNNKNADTTINVPQGKVILDTAEAEGIDLPYSCRAGSCSSCIGVLKSGKVDQSSQIFLTDEQVDKGFVLTCVATPLSDVEIEVDAEEKFYNEQ